MSGDPLFVVTLDAPPMVIVNDDGLSGMAAELARESLLRAGFDPVFQIAPWKRAVYMTVNGDTDALFYAVFNEERDKVFHYPKVPLFKIEIVALKRAKSAVVITPDLKGLEKWVIGIGRGFAYGPKVMEFIDRAGFKKVEVTASNDINFGKLMDHRIDLLLADKNLARYFRDKPGMGGETDFVRDEEGEIVVLNSMDVYLVFSKKTRSAEDAARLSDALNAMKADGTYLSILRRYQ
ncbi:MAG: transporter substrate-binding domain-containing protein [Pseudodesulfovibrio sp.]